MNFYAFKMFALALQCIMIQIVTKPALVHGAHDIADTQSNEVTERQTTVYVEAPKPKANLTDKLDSMLTNNKKTPYDRIVGGEDVSEAGVYPFFANWEWACGASLVARDVLLTAAHCDVLKSNEVVVNAYLAKNKTTENAFPRKIIQRKKHAGFNQATLKNDFMLLKLNEIVDNPYVMPIKLNFDSSIPEDGESLRVIGMGRLLEGTKTSSEILQEVDVNMWTQEECSDVYGSDTVDEKVMFCAGHKQGGKDACQGDSGGPIFRMTSTGKVEKQVGVVSWGAGCARGGYPGVYADTSGISSWLQTEICRLSDDTNIFYECQPTEDEIQLKVEVTLDKYSTESSWTIFDDSSGKPIAWEYSKSFHQPFETYTRSVNLKENSTYVFRMEDSAKDGICCRYGSGSYTLRQGPWTLASGGDFKSVEDTKFTVYRNGPPPPSASPSISHSASPSVSHSASPSVSHSASPSVPPSASPSVSPSPFPSMPPSASPSIRPTLRGQDKNGIDSFQTEESSRDDASASSIESETVVGAEIVSDGNSSNIVIDDEESLLKTENDTTSVERNSTNKNETSLTEKNTTIQTSAITTGDKLDDCRDTNETIEIDRQIGMKSCSWLSVNFDRFDYLCRFVDVALACPHTCGTCSLVHPETEN